MTHHLVIVYTVSKHRTERAARQALKRLMGSGDDIAMVVEFPDEKKVPPSYLPEETTRKKEKRK